MQTIVRALAALSVIVGMAAPLRADDQADARALVQKGIEARGGEANLAKYPATTFKLKGQLQAQGQTLGFTGDYAAKLPGRARMIIEVEAGGQKFVFGQVANGDKAWRKLGEQVEELTGEALKDGQESNYTNWVTSLLPLKDKAFTLSTLGESKVGERPALGVKVTRAGHGEIKLFFDKETGLLLKSQRKTHDDMSKKMFDQEELFSDYKEIDGILEPTKLTIKRDGAVFVESETYDLKHLEKLEDSIFVKP